jgi:hypothetical protein
MGNMTSWVADKLTQGGGLLKVLDRTPEDFLVIEAKDEYTFLVAVLGIQEVIQILHVQPLFAGAAKPQLVVNVPSRTLWSGAAIDFVHSVPAAFGTIGDIGRAAATKSVQLFRDKDMGFFINAIQQHTNVTNVEYVYDSVFRAERRNGASLTVAVIDAYNMSAEDVRNARTLVGNFDVVVKSSSYGSITEQAQSAAESIGAEALTFRGLMQRLAR